MEAITIHQGTTIPLMNNNIDTDQIIPKQFLKNILKIGYGKHLFNDWRYLDDGTPNPDFILNAPERKNATILISGDNFGCGSSREHAAWALKDWGFKIIIAGSYSDIFFMNCTKNGLLPITLPQSARDYLAQLAPDQTITIDLPHQKVSCPSKTYSFDIDATWKEKFIQGIDDIDLTLQHAQEIHDFEKKIPVF
ncbi:MAG: 3-isopropylmalate dehydratase small subunit [Liquorilactobacillus nagelii]|jgi:3-isopropylmalate/(R)-2-methylmalate dehydratase small subunit|uniref:3-isopropylmalate dehydratase small subunit n=1 Tax=Liquorilactobacillus nagelii TaxID=82688 RepID=A0A3Q8CYM3_9LACO|nr:3-isopropylmalate dehydratase small subunit [Liquorilactobacillus nagelii]AUJ31122.1 3-isopropylmalate dehydratase small subunit [Liquorilactobacillus nagelii]MCC7616474.1 3-isopropylmalate dehydratase small subunit [Liquorilactobacillus nagelii]MCP9315354.1 3-isopropylmalate dehydratase small subunit [Liquorilactobacillus nagelii]